MYAEFRPVDVAGRTASTPEAWAANFARSARLNKWRELRLASWREMKLIRRHIPPGARILDAGCGYGEWVTLLRKRGYAAEGLDYSKRLVDRLKIEYPDTPWHLGDIRNPGDGLGMFDAIISWGVIEHDPDGPGAALRQLARILRPRGIGIFTVPRDDEANRAAR
jgi:SAM-dependent methyltransferase